MVLSLFLGKNRTLLSLLERTDNYFSLKFINQLNHPIQLDTIYSEESMSQIVGINRMLDAYISQITKVIVTVDSNHYILTHIPGDVDFNGPEFAELVNLEIRQTYPDKSINDFRTKLSRQKLLGSGNSMNLVTIISNEIIQNIEYLVANLGFEISDINPLPFSAINAYLYNYPEDRSKCSILVKFDKKLIEFAVISEGEIIGYEFCPLSAEMKISDALELKLENITADYPMLDLACIYFYGDGFTKEQYLECWEIGMLMSGDSKRLNPYRLMHTDLKKRDLDYCSRTFQNYVPCIGGALPTQFPIVVH